MLQNFFGEKMRCQYWLLAARWILPHILLHPLSSQAHPPPLPILSPHPRIGVIRSCQFLLLVMLLQKFAVKNKKSITHPLVILNHSTPSSEFCKSMGGLAFCGFSFSTAYSAWVSCCHVYPHFCTFVLVPMCPLLRYGLEFEPVVGFDLLGVYLQGRRPAPALRLTSEGLWPIVSRMQA